MALLAALPLVAVLALMLIGRWSAARAGTVGLLLALLLGLTVFDLAEQPGGPAGATAGALSEAAFTAAAILWIIVPALAIHRLQLAGGAVDRLRQALTGLSGDPRVTALLAAWFFALLLEGAAGFGTAAALAAPFLVALGLSPVRAVAAALLGHVVGVSFGAVGTPIVPQAAATGFAPAALAAATAAYGALLGWVMLGALVAMLERGKAQGWSAAGRPKLWPWALVAGALFLLPFLALATFLGPELPTLGGALLGGGLFVALLLAVGRRTGRRSPAGIGLSQALSSAAPYLALVAIVLLTRLLGPMRELLQSVELRWSLFEGAYGAGLQPLYHPGTMLFAALLLGAAWQRRPPGQVAQAVGQTVRQIGAVSVALLAMLGLARLMLHGGLVEALALAAAGALGGWWPLVAPAVGALGTFVTGSATASNALFSDLQAATALTAGLSPLEVLGAQGMGAAAGNAIAPHNLIAAAAVVGIAGREAEILRRTAPATLLYLLLGGGLALAISLLP